MKAFLRISIFLFILFFCKMSCGQDTTRIVKGVVVGEDKKLLPGVTIQQKNTQNATMSDRYGEFMIEVPADKDVILLCSYISQPKEVIVKSNKNFVKIKFRFSDRRTYIGLKINCGLNTYSSERLLLFNKPDFMISSGIYLNMKIRRRLLFQPELLVTYRLFTPEEKEFIFLSIDFPLKLKYRIGPISIFCGPQIDYTIYGSNTTDNQYNILSSFDYSTVQGVSLKIKRSEFEIGYIKGFNKIFYDNSNNISLKNKGLYVSYMKRF